MKRKQESGIYTYEELRDLHGLDFIEGTNELYIDSNLVPIGQSQNTDPSELKSYIEVLAKNGFTEKEIKQHVEKHYGNSN